ncbi:hypothetical protein V8J82_11905 [Gymnodinialimonas sp. 2305UL16-5]|uniref:hypothetical protein n=1 Tax=Gymnodinialimonas mytili TaxID=3126503 RepID=UPI0030AD0412
MTLPEYVASMELERIDALKVGVSDLEKEIERLLQTQKNGRSFVRVELVLLGGIALYYFGIQGGILLGTISLEISVGAVSAILLLFSIFNVFFFSNSQSESIQRAFIVAIIDQNPELDAAGLLRRRFAPMVEPQQQLRTDIMAGKLSINPFRGVLSIFSFSAALVGLAGIFFFAHIPISTAWSIGESADWPITNMILLILVIVGTLSRTIFVFALDYLKFRFSNPALEQRFWENYEKDGFDVAYSVLMEDLRDNA